MALPDIDLVEINEAFAPVVLRWEKADDAGQGERQRRAIALGHPVAAPGPG